jgi:hypothetical protein
MARPDKARPLKSRPDEHTEIQLLLTHLRADFVPESAAREDHEWLEAVRSGNFDAIPATLGYQDNSALGHLVDSYNLLHRLGWGDPSAFLDKILAAARRTGTGSGTALELWITLFLQYRADRMAGGTSDEDLLLLDELCAALRRTLLEVRM